jgi:hypothetical protein
MYLNIECHIRYLNIECHIQIRNLSLIIGQESDCDMSDTLISH